MEVVVTATNSGGSASSTFRLTIKADTTEPEQTAPASELAPSFSGTGVIGTPVEANAGTWSGSPAPVLALQWFRDGSAIEGATSATYLPVDADDRSALTCRVTATNAAGTTAAETEPLAVTHAAPVAAGGLADVQFVRGSGPQTLDAAGDFTGADLAFTVTGDGAAIDAATGIVTISTDALRDGIEVVVTATNSGGNASSGFRLDVIAEVTEPELVAPASQVAPSLSGTGVIGTEVEVDAGSWTGTPVPELALQWLRDGGAIEGATASVYVPVAADDRGLLTCRVTATNSAGSATAVATPLAVTRVPPVAAGGLADVQFVRGSGPQTVGAAGDFTGAELAFTMTGDGAVIDAVTGVVTISTDALRENVEIVVTAANWAAALRAVSG